MEKDYDEEVEEIYDDYSYEEPNEEEKELLEIEKEQSTKLKNGQVEFKYVNHSERAVKFGRVSDGDTTKYVNIALEYFGHRCALSGERFQSFDKKVDGKKSNLSAEHVVALFLGGDDIVPNIVPTVLQYNLRKNGYYLLDYWDKQKDIEGKSLYSPYRLLKLVNYMMKSIDARDLKSIKDYRKVIMTPNEIDEFLAEIEKQDELEPDNSKKKIHSDTQTATTVDEDNKKILTEVPQLEGNIPTQREQLERFRQNEIDMMDIFLSDAVGLLNRTQELQQIQLKDNDGNEISLQDKLDDMLKSTIGVIPFEVEVRNTILEKLEALGVQDNKYSVANDLLNNTTILEMAKANRENVEYVVKNYIENQLTRIRGEQILSEEQLKTVISNMPTILYDEKEMNKIRLWSNYRSDSFEELISRNYTATDNFIDALIILKNNGINLVYEDEKGKIVNTIQAKDTIEKMLERYPNLTKEQKEKIQVQLEELGVNPNIEITLRNQKNDKNKEKFKKVLIELRAKLQQEGIQITEKEWEILTESKKRSQDPTTDMVNVIEVLKRNGINLVYEDAKGKIVNTIQQEDTIEKMLKRYPNLTKEQKEKIQGELEELGVNPNIGQSLSQQKLDENKEKFKKALIELRTKLQQEGIQITEKEWKNLTEKQISKNPTADIVNGIEVLKRNGIKLVYEDEKGKIVNTIQAKETIEKMLERYPNLTKEQKEKIQVELEELGVNPNIGQSLNKQKNDKNKEKFKKALIELRIKLQQEGIQITEKEWKNLTEKQISENPTADIVNVIEVLKRNGINLVYEDEKGKIVKTIQAKDTIEKMLERYPNLTKEQKGKIQIELEEQGVNPNIGQSLNNQKTRNKEAFENALIELRAKLEQDGIEITEKEWEILTESKKRSQDPTVDMVNVIEVLKRNGINLVYEDEKGKIVNTIRHRDTIEKMLKRYPNLTKEQKEKIQVELEELGVNPNIGYSLDKQKRDKNKEKFKKALIELKVKLEQDGIEITEKEWKLLTEKRTQKKIKETVVEQKNNGELGQNQQIEDDVFEETIKQAEQAKESEVVGR